MLSSRKTTFYHLCYILGTSKRMHQYGRLHTQNVKNGHALLICMRNGLDVCENLPLQVTCISSTGKPRTISDTRQGIALQGNVQVQVTWIRSRGKSGNCKVTRDMD